jgi:hypothetical protein
MKNIKNYERGGRTVENHIGTERQKKKAKEYHALSLAPKGNGS